MVAFLSRSFGLKGKYIISLKSLFVFFFSYAKMNFHSQKRVIVRFKEYKGFPHYFWTFPGKSLKTVAEEYQKDGADAMRWLLS
jgi:hypothetical protein